MTPDVVDTLVRVAVMGLGAAMLMDVWAFVLRRGFGVPTLDYALLGRWVGHLPAGRFTHERIAASSPVRSERLLGWCVHYAIGIVFAAVLVAIVGPAWLHDPTPWPAMAVGLGTVVAPWFVMQPAMGAGFAGSRSADPRATRLRNLGTHAVYGIGLSVTALVMSTTT